MQAFLFQFLPVGGEGDRVLYSTATRSQRFGNVILMSGAGGQWWDAGNLSVCLPRLCSDRSIINRDRSRTRGSFDSVISQAVNIVNTFEFASLVRCPVSETNHL